MRATILVLLCGVAMAAAAPPDPAPTLPREPALSDRDRAHWAFQQPRRVDPPAVKDAGWIKTPIDTFIRAAQEKAGLQPASPLDRAALLRRVTFDLIGLPPTPEQLAAFLSDTRPDAYERVVDRLLASPHFGEHWAQHWLDVVRYAESDGYEADTPRPHAWRYRDYVVRAFNRDLPYNRFVTEQIAGDLLAAKATPHPRPLSPEGRGENAEADLLIAAGLHRCGPVHLTSGNIDPAVARQEVLTEITNGVATAFLGLTMGCAAVTITSSIRSPCSITTASRRSSRPFSPRMCFWPPIGRKPITIGWSASTKPSRLPCACRLPTWRRLTGRRSRPPSDTNWTQLAGMPSIPP